MNPSRALTRSVALAARMPGPLLPVGVMVAAASSTGSMFTTATLTTAALVGLSISAPAAGAAADRFGARNVLLISAIMHVLMLVLMVSTVERLTRGDPLTSSATIYVLLLVYALLAGLSTPAVGAFSRADRAGTAEMTIWLSGSPGGQDRGGSPDPEPSGGEGLRGEGRLQDMALIAAPLLLALFSLNFGPTVGLVCSAVLTASAVPLCAVDRSLATEASTESARLPLGGAEHAQQLLIECRTLASAGSGAQQHEPENLPGAASRRVPSVPGGPVASVPDAPVDWGRSLGSAVALAAALGLVLGGLWVSVLDAAQSLSRPGLLGLTLGLMATAGVLCARWRPSDFTAPLMLRRRRLHAALLVMLSVITLLLAAGLPAGPSAVLAVSVAAVLQSALLGRLMLGLCAGLAIATPVRRLSAAVSAVAGGVLLGLALGLTLAGIAADEIAPGWSAAVTILGSLGAAVVVLSDQLAGSPGRAGRSAGPPGVQQ